MGPQAGLLTAGRIGPPHGLDGSFRVLEPVSGLLVAGGIVYIDGTARRIERRFGHDRRVLLQIEGCTDRDAAMALRGSALQVERSVAPALEDDEWWADDLEGCAVVDGELAVGMVARLMALPSCEVLVVERASGGPDLLVPLVSDAVRSVQIDAKVIDIDLTFLGEES